MEATTGKNPSNSLPTRQLIQRYFTDCISLEGYPQSDLPPVLQFRDIFKSEYGYPENIRRHGDGQKLFTEYLMGLPSCLTVAFYYADQRELLSSWGIPAPDDDWAMSQKFYAVLYREYRHLLTLHKA